MFNDVVAVVVVILVVASIFLRFFHCLWVSGWLASCSYERCLCWICPEFQESINETRKLNQNFIVHLTNIFIGYIPSFFILRIASVHTMIHTRMHSHAEWIVYNIHPMFWFIDARRHSVVVVVVVSLLRGGFSEVLVIAQVMYSSDAYWIKMQFIYTWRKNGAKSSNL